ncbi:MAG: gas vesicle protein K [Chloroflexi bacterium]|nr:gas vesicle protein K [Chloroflexota bacterium]
MIVDIAEKDLKQGVLGLVVALVEIVKEALRLQALRRMEAGSLTEQEIERLGEALQDLDGAIEKLKVEMGVAEAVRSVRDGLDQAVEDAVAAFLDPGRWELAQLGVSRGAER